MARRYSTEQWAAWVEEQRESALSVRGFCDWIGVSQNALCWWRRKLAARQMHATVTQFSGSHQSDVRSLFVPLTVVGSPVIEVDLPAYISWEQYLENQEQLKQNRAMKGSRGAPRHGEALLSGLVVCGQCGHHMNTRYPGDKKPCYQCNEYYTDAVAELREPCGRIAATTIDDLVTREVLRALEPAALELSFQAIENVERDRKRLHDQWHLRLERVQQEAMRAERQYHLTEPENRLVARTLEARWENALKRQREAEEEYNRFLRQQPATLSSDERHRIGALAEDVGQVWNASCGRPPSLSDRRQTESRGIRTAPASR
ncbi:MAG: zinc ribbon domain-containing protein [Planctomycetaceae bacterium]|nr:zinc ribbon domain-containing protein [Planctomycetaceae bacterium]